MYLMLSLEDGSVKQKAMISKLDKYAVRNDIVNIFRFKGNVYQVLKGDGKWVAV